MSADIDVDVDTGQGAGVEAEARELGWVPKDEWRGSVEKWVPAEEFVERGHVVMPILRKNNERLLQTQQGMQTQLAQLKKELEASRNDFATLQEFHQDELTRRTKELRANLLEQIKDAKRESDIDKEVDLTDKLTQLNAANTAAERGLNGKHVVDGEDEGGQQALPPNPAYDAWVSANPWFMSDPERSHEAMAVGFRVTKEMPHLRGEAFFDEVDKRLAKGQNVPGRAGKVEGSRGGRTASNGAGRTYADLPADAKRQCDIYAKRFVNPNGQFKTEADYRKHYVTLLENTGAFE